MPSNVPYLNPGKRGRRVNNSAIIAPIAHISKTKEIEMLQNSQKDRCPRNRVSCCTYPQQKCKLGTGVVLQEPDTCHVTSFKDEYSSETKQCRHNDRKNDCRKSTSVWKHIQYKVARNLFLEQDQNQLL